MAGERIVDWDSSFIKGTNSSMAPGELPLGYLWHTINMLTIAGVTACRPGHRCIVELPPGNLQGAAIFRPLLGLEQMLVAVEGAIFVAEYPFTNFRVLPNVLFVAHAKQIFWKQAYQAAERITPGSLTSAVRVIEPKAVMMMQDGGFTAPAFYDGTTSGHIRDLPFQTPAGGPMEWIGDRLWVANENRVFASDISNPFSFVEQQYLGGTSFFNFSSPVTAMTKTPSIEFPQLLVFTDEDATVIQADIRDRSLWPTTQGFQREVLQVGCPSNRGVISTFGVVTWFTPSGLAFFDFASMAHTSSRAPIRDNELMVSKLQIADDLSLVSMGIFGQFMVCSVPAEDQYNKHTWVLNSASWETITDQGGAVWNGHWLGTRPVEWVYGVIAGTERIYHVAHDADCVNRLWESFLPDQLDNGCPIAWAAFSRGYFGQSSQKKTPGIPCRFLYADVGLACIDEHLDLAVFVAPGMRGQFHQILSKRLSAEEGSLAFDKIITADSNLYAFKGQTRKERTEDLNIQAPDYDSGTCPVESPKSDEVDDNFQMLVVGHGPATLSYIRPFALVAPDEDGSGSAEACENEEDFRALRFDGAGVFNADNQLIVEPLADMHMDFWESTKTAMLTVDGISAVGVGYSSSVVSQQAADRVAERIATRMAEIEILAQLPPVLSIGEGFEDGFHSPC